MSPNSNHIYLVAERGDGGSHLVLHKLDLKLQGGTVAARRLPVNK